MSESTTTKLHLPLYGNPPLLNDSVGGGLAPFHNLEFPIPPSSTPPYGSSKFGSPSLMQNGKILCRIQISFKSENKTLAGTATLHYRL